MEELKSKVSNEMLQMLLLVPQGSCPGPILLALDKFNLFPIRQNEQVYCIVLTAVQSVCVEAIFSLKFIKIKTILQPLHCKPKPQNLVT